MAVERVDKYTRKTVDEVTYSDFYNNFNAHPNTGNLLVRNNEDAVSRAIKNLIQTEPNERLFNPSYGCELRKLLFENNDSTLRSAVRSAIEYSINTFEPRAKLEDVVISNTDDHSITVDIYYRVMRQENINLLNIKLDRVR
jgi:phage baseplate assembly protein W